LKVLFSPPPAARDAPAPIGEPAKLTMEIPIELRAAQVNFAFKDVIVP